jgi:hypothetical protein
MRVVKRDPLHSFRLGFATNCNRFLLLLFIPGVLLVTPVITRAATLTVTSTADNGAGTLRQAISDAASGDTIIFSLPAGSTIGLMSGTLLIDKSLTITGPGAQALSVRNVNPGAPSNEFRIFTIPTGTFNVAISGLTITGARGGGLSNGTSSLTLSRCAISGNQVPGSGSGGGGIANTGTMIVTECTISSNSSTSMTFGGGGILNRGTLTITNSTIAGNGASPRGGGAIQNDSQPVPGGTPLVGTVNLTNCTISGNTSTFVAGGIHNLSGNTVNASTTIIARNEVFFSGTPPPDYSGELTSLGYNLIGDSSGATINSAPGDQIGTHDLPIDPRLGPLQDNGGSTQTRALLANSPAINAGNDAAAPPRDQRGYLRSGVSDIGAFEFGGTLPVTLANISTRVQVGHGDEGLFAGFIITGSQPKRLLLRALGASLPLTGTLANTTLTLYNSAGQVIEFNDDWRTNSNAAEIEATGLAPGHDTESALLLSLAPGTYTALVSGGAMFAPALGLVEVYDLDRTVTSRLANISSRGLVQTGDNVMIAGVIVLGADSQRVIVRALGPSVNVPGHLLDPTLELRDSNATLLASNDNWRSDQAAEISATGLPPPNDAESATVRILPPAAYTAIVRGANATRGIALVEVYALN